MTESETTSRPLPWYKEGLKFECTQCGKCCTGSPGYVWVSKEEMLAMALSLNIDLATFKRLYVKSRDNKYLLVERKSQNHTCVFYKDQKCAVYSTRPLQCRTYPFWPENLQSKESWESCAKECEGIREEAPIISVAEIEHVLNQNSREN